MPSGRRLPLLSPVSSVEFFGIRCWDLLREDLAVCIMESLRNYHCVGKTIEIVSGGKKIKEAIGYVVGGQSMPAIL